MAKLPRSTQVLPNGQREASLALIAVRTAVSNARRFVTLTLQDWGLTQASDTAVLLASELVTNAVRATGSLAEPGVERNLGWVRIRLTAFASSVYVEVWDAEPRLPVVQPYELEDQAGRGLLLVAAMSKRWGCYPSPRGGKVVWCEVELPVTSTGLPKRTWRIAAFTPTDVMRDRGLLLRVRDALASL